jgi:hypothetical protein
LSSDFDDYSNFIFIFISNVSKFRLIKFSPDLEEIDLRNNSIGNVGAKMLLNALEYRKLSKIKL